MPCEASMILRQALTITCKCNFTSDLQLFAHILIVREICKSEESFYCTKSFLIDICTARNKCE